MRRPRPSPALYVLLLAATAGCASGTGSSPPSVRSSYDVPAPAPRYETQAPAGAAVQGRQAVAIEKGIQAAGAQHGLVLQADPRLATLADWIADHFAPDRPMPPNAAVDLASRGQGLFEPSPHLFAFGVGDSDDILQRVAQEMGAPLSQHDYTHFGAVERERRGGSQIFVALSWRRMQSDPVPSQVDPGTTIPFRGTLNQGYSTPEVAITAPNGSVQRFTAGSSQSFATELRLQERGIYRIELIAQGPRGSTVVANFPVYVGVEPTTKVEVAVQGAADMEHASEEFLERINGERAKLKLPALKPLPELSRIAMAHNHDMNEHSFVGHTSPTTGPAEQRVRTAGVRTRTVLENIGRGYSFQEVHDGLMASPGHRENILNRRVTHVGIAALEQDEGGRSAYLVTQVFIRRAPVLEGDGADLLLAAINEARGAAGAPPLAKDAALDDRCSRFALQFFADPGLSREGLVSLINKDLGAVPVDYRKLGALMTVVDGLDQAASIRQVMDPQAHAIGIGLAQGTRQDTSENAISVVMMLGY